MTRLKADGNTLEINGEELVLSRAWSDTKEHLIAFEGAVREGDLIVKRFPASRFHASTATIKAAENLFRGSVDFVSGMSGYSSLDEARCAELNIRVGEYEAAVMGIMESAINRVRFRAKRVRYGLVYGSSSMGVDLAMQEVAEKENLPILGYICLAYLWYVDASPDGPPICIKATKQQYCEAYVGACDLLMACNGGRVSYEMDTIAAMKRFIPVIPVNVIGMLGSSIPAFRPDGSVNDAAAVLEYGIRMINVGMAAQSHAEDRYTSVAGRFADAVTARVREVAEPKFAFEPLAV